MSQTWKAQPASKIGRSIVTQVATAQTNASQSTTTFGSQTRQVRIVHNFAGGIWATVDTTATVTANSSAIFLPANLPEYFCTTPGQQLNFISTSTTTGYVVVTEMRRVSVACSGCSLYISCASYDLAFTYPRTFFSKGRGSVLEHCDI